MAKDKEKKEKEKCRKPKLTKTETEKPGPELSAFESKFEIEGIKKLVLSSITQRAIGCIVGENITTEEPWVFIKKEKIQDNLDLHEDSSEFLPIKKCIMDYPEEEMLIGFDKPIEDDMQEFFICGNVGCKNTVVSIIETQKAEMQERLKQSVCKRPRKWTTLGSETEVDENILQNLRALIEVEFESKYPLYSEKKKFKMRKVEEAIDGYVEILPGRFPISNVYRKRVDAGIQVAPPTIDNEAQTNPTYPKHVWTQYQYEYAEPKLNAASIKHLTEFVYHQAESLSDTIHVNEHINLYTNDYTKMSKPVYISSVIVNRDMFSFRDVLACKGKMVSDVCLNPMMSGILAASYTKAPFNRILSSEFTEDEVNEITFGQHLTLLWCYSDALTPKLYLHSFREVNVLAYCPFKPNILVGGCTNGQIVLWDLNGKLEKVETREILTPSEQKHRLIMWSLMTWMHNTNNINELLPTAVSALDFCHKDVVTHISWILPEYEITRNGKIVYCTEPEGSMQFMTCGLDGRILIWDLLKKPHGAPVPRPKKSQRLEKRPSALTMDISEFRDLNNIMIPQYKVNVKNQVTTLPYPLTTIHIRNSNFDFEVINPETADDCLKRTYYKPVKSGKPYEFTPSFSATDKLGNLFQCKFEGHDFDQGQRVNYENCKYTEFMLVHDGPIRVCTPNNLDENIMLTVGGRVFALWDMRIPDKPMFWRKCKVRYVSGIWSSQLLGGVVVSRADSYFETWELLTRTKTPGRLVRMTGNAVLDHFSDSKKNHVRKRTFITTDVVGAVRVYRVPTPSIRKHNEDFIKYAFKLKDRIYERKRKLNEWVQMWKEKHGYVETVEEEQREPAQPKQEPGEDEKSEEEGGEEGKEAEKPKEKDAEAEKPAKADEEPDSTETQKNKEIFSKLTGTNTWHEKQEKIMYEILLQKKKLNLAEIEQHKIPLQKLIDEQQHKSIEIGKILANKEKIFDTAQKMIFKEKKIKKRAKFRVTFPEEIVQVMKETYLKEYHEAVEDTLRYIRCNQFHYGFVWSHMIKQGKERRKSFTDHIKNVNRRRRDSTKKISQSYKDMSSPKLKDASKITVTASAIDYTHV